MLVRLQQLVNWTVYLRKQGKHPMLVAADVYRPAAITQLQVVGKQIDIPVFADEHLVPIQ